MAYNNVISRTDSQALVPEEVSDAMLVSLGAAQGSAALQLGTRVPVGRNQVRFPVLSALPVAYWVNGDTGLKQTSEAAWANKYLNIEELAVIVPIPDAVIDDTAFDVWGAVRPLMESAISRAIDAAIFFGISAPGSFPTNITSAAITATNTETRGTNAAAAGGLYGDYSDLLGKLEAEGILPDAAIGNATLKARERNMRDTLGQPIARPADMPDIMFAMPGLWPSGSGAAELIVGAFARSLVVGVRKDFTYSVTSEGVITDDSGNIIFNLFQQDMTALRLVFRMGWAVSNPINYQQQVEASRYPFGVLRAP